MIHVSPTALNYVPVLLLHVVSLGYLLLKGAKSRQTWLFCGWLGGMTLMTATQFAACTVYAPRISGYLGWWGGVAGVTLAMIALLQFAYHVPRLRYPREAQIVLTGSILITGTLFLWMGWETFTASPHHVYATAPVEFEPALASQKAWLSYNFERFNAGFLSPRDAGPLVSFKIFDLWQVAGNLWILIIWLRKTVQCSERPAETPFWRRTWEALRRPQGREARLARAWVLLMVLSPLPVIASSLDGTDVLPPGTFATVHLLVLFAIVLTYVNHAPEPTSFMVKLVGISLVTLLIIMKLISSYAMQAYREAYARTRHAELQHIQTLIDTQHFQDLPADILYLAARPAEGLFASAYQMIAARPEAPDVAALAAHDAFRRTGLIRTHFPTRYLALHEHPWLGLKGISALENDPERIDTLIIPEGVAAYRGSSSYPKDHILRYTFIRQDTLYEVGYSYPAYRAYLHRKTLPLLSLFVGTTVAILVAFPHFFQVGLIAPLNRLLQGVDRVDSGELDVNVPVTIEDEIGRLTHAFNRMVASLRTSEHQLRDLNLTLEARIAEQTRDLTTLYEISAIGSQVQNLDYLLKTSLEQTLAALQSETGAIYLISRITAQPTDTPPRTLHLAFQQGFPAAHIPPSRIETVGEGAIGWVITHQQPLLVSHADRASLQDVRWLAQTLDNQNLLLAPLRAERRIVGLLLLARPVAFSFTTREISLVTSIADQIGVSARSERLRQEATLLAERQRIARDLHDTVTQSLYGMVVLTEAGQVQVETLALPQESQIMLERWLHTVGETARQAIKEMRLFIYELQPPALREEGLVGALHQRLASVEGRANVEARLLADETLRLPPAMERALYQITREALNNALRHAQAANVTITWGREENAALLEVWDDGCGFDTQALPNPGMGLSNMRHRAEAIGATFKIVSAPGGGTRVHVLVPNARYETKE